MKSSYLGVGAFAFLVILAVGTRISHEIAIRQRNGGWDWLASWYFAPLLTGLLITLEVSVLGAVIATRYAVSNQVNWGGTCW